MKKVILTAVLFLFCGMIINAQTMNIHLKGGKVVPLRLSDIEKVTYDAEPQFSAEPQKTMDAMISDMTQLASLAQQYYKKPTTLGGGGNSFKGWWIPENMKDNKNGTYTFVAEDELVTITGACKSKGADGHVMGADMVVSKDMIKSVTIK